MNSHISISNLYKSFKNKKVLQGINLEIYKGQSVAIIGGSGSGKSVLIKNIAGLIPPDAGSILLDGIEVNNISQKDYHEVTKRFGFLFQGGALFDSLSVWENVAFSLIQECQHTLKQAKEIAIDTLATVGLGADVANLFPAELSGGMLKRAALARAVIGKPEILFFDEPTTGLDPVMSNVINDLIIKSSQELNATSITITHDMNSVLRIAQRVVMLYQGNIIWDGKIDDLFSSGNELVNQFVHGNIEGPLHL
jgi:phospholipid/cholesterol/gamma-HCH transport system ATP-binding protein